MKNGNGWELVRWTDGWMDGMAWMLHEFIMGSFLRERGLISLQPRTEQ